MERSIKGSFINNIIRISILLWLSINTDAQKLSLGAGNVLYICEDSTVSAIGYNKGDKFNDGTWVHKYQLGDGTDIDRNYPVKVKGIHNAISVNAIGSIALLSDGSIWKWTKDSVYNFHRIDIDSVISISAGLINGIELFYCAIKKDGSLWLWSEKEKEYTCNLCYKSLPVKVDIPKVKKVEAGQYCVIALCEDGSVWTWGDRIVDGNGNDIEGVPDIYEPSKVNSLTDVIDVCAGIQNVYALKKDGTIWGWGYNVIDRSSGNSYPAKYKISDVKSISTGIFDALHAIKNDGTLWYWTDSIVNHVMISKSGNVYPKKINTPTKIEKAFSSGSNTFVFDEYGDMYRWGSNGYGQLGNFTTFPIDSPEIMPHPCIAVNCDTITKNPDILKLDTLVFPGQSVNLTASPSDADLYWWYPRSNIISGKYNQEAVVRIIDDTEFSAVIMDKYGCMRKERFMLRKKCDTNIKLALDSTTFPTAKLVLSADSGTLYSWTPSANLSCTNCQQTIATITDSITYFVSYIDTFNCPVMEKFIFRMRVCDTSTFNNPLLMMDTVAYPNSEICLKLPVMRSYSWQPETGLSCIDCYNPNASITDSITYIVSITDSVYCISKEKFIIRIRNCDTIQLNDQIVRLDTVINYTTDIQFIASESYSDYKWTPTDGLSCIDCQNPIIIAGATSDYFVEVSDKWRCPYKEEFKVTLNILDVVVPNVFSPNNDGINDYFEIIGLMPGSNLKIYDSKGILVFSSGNYEGNWDGKDSHGTQLNEGTYWYIIDIPYHDTYKGWVYIKR